MQTLPDLKQLSHEQKDELIILLKKQVDLLQQEVAELKRRLGLDSRNSSKPPSGDGLKKPAPKSLRKAGRKRPGGQKGHPGTTLSQTSNPDHVELHAPPAQCDVCQRRLPSADADDVAEIRQVFDLPLVRMEVTEHRALQAYCQCGKLHRGEFPQQVTSNVQYGPGAKAAMVYLNHHQMLPVQRTASLMDDFFGLPVSQATVISACQEARMRVQPTVDAIAEAMIQAPVLHADESGLRVQKRLYWLHVLATPLLTWMGRHERRGMEAFEAFAILPRFNGTLVHDGWAPYRRLDCSHGLCNAHHLRELTCVFEQYDGQAWAGDMIRLLGRASHEHNRAMKKAPARNDSPAQRQRKIKRWRARYDRILDLAEAANPPSPGIGQGKPYNLVRRLREYADDVWRFMSEPGVPFTNNVAEQAVRMPKVKQKISGCFRTPEGADTFCVIRSYLATLHKQGQNLLDALSETFRGNPVQPRWC